MGAPAGGGRQLGSAPRPSLLCWGPRRLGGGAGGAWIGRAAFPPEDPCAPVLKGTINLGPQGQWGVGWRQISAPAAPFSGPTAFGTLWVFPVRFLWEPLHSPQSFSCYSAPPILSPVSSPVPKPTRLLLDRASGRARKARPGDAGAAFLQDLPFYLVTSPHSLPCAPLHPH